MSDTKGKPVLSGATHEQRNRLGELLKQRRVELDPRYRVRQAFAADVGISDRIISDLEHARRPNFGSDTIAGFERAYRLVYGSLIESATTGELKPRPGTPGGAPARAEEAASPADRRPVAVVDERTTAVITAAVDGSPLEEQVRELVSGYTDDTPGREIFGQGADAMIWDDRRQPAEVRIRMIAALWALRQEPDETAHKRRVG